jgi:hypothetical protein
MSYLIGILLAIAICGVAGLLRLDQARWFYPAMLAVIAVLYVCFALLSHDTAALPIEMAVAGGFLILAAVGYRWLPGLIVLGLAAHGTFDYLHPALYRNSGVPEGWPEFCLAFDGVAALCVAMLLIGRRLSRLGQDSPPAAPAPWSARPIRPHHLVVLHHRKRLIEMMQQPLPLLVGRRSSKPHRVVLEPPPPDEQQVLILYLETPLQLVRHVSVR